MRLTHVSVTMPPDCEGEARAFYGGLLGLREIPKPEPNRSRGGVWFDADGLDIHVAVEESQGRPSDARRHFGLEHPDVVALRARLEAGEYARKMGGLRRGGDSSCWIRSATG